jgi:antitoxin (DNA-binding transcriptional repressor) of toxin-antitoxin stability system
MPKTAIKDEKTLTVTEMSRKFADYINRVVYRGEKFILIRGNKPVAEIRPISDASDRLPNGLSGKEFLELFKSLPHLTPDEAEAFGRDIDEAREEANKIPIRDPWEEI